MTINAADFRQFVIAPAVSALSQAGIPVTNTAADLLIATAAMETDLGTWLAQMGGPALGVFQIEPVSLTTVINSASRAEMLALQARSAVAPATAVVADLVYAAMICRLFYWQVRAPLPPDTVSGLWGYYKEYYNTPLGAATKSDFLMAIRLTDLGGLPA